jgi:uncharacterized membrane protein
MRPNRPSTSPRRRNRAGVSFTAMAKNARNIGIILLVALGVDLIPGGGEAANTAQQAVYLVFLAVLCWFASIMYRQHRASLYSLGDKRRGIVYVSIGALVLVLSALYRVSGPSAVLAIVVAGIALYAIVAIYLAARQY